MNIRRATINDRDTIVNFQLDMAMETENMQLDKINLYKGVQKFFDEPMLGTYWMVDHDDQSIASTLIQYEWSDWRNCWVWWIHSVYVLPENRKSGAFRMLYKHLKAMVEKSDDVGGLRLFVDKTNVRAQKVYEAMGMNGDHYQLFEWMTK
jgi:GNAT superfamily N-acetyltransferase